MNDNTKMRYSILDSSGDILASNMKLSNIMLFMEAYFRKFYEWSGDWTFTIRQDRNCVEEKS